MLGGVQGACAHQRAEGVSGGEAGVLSKCERKRRTRQRPSLFCCARGGIFAFCRGGVLPCPWHFAAAPVMHFVGAGVLDGPFIFFRRESSAPSGAGHFWPQRPAAQALSVPPAAPFLSAAKEMGERTPPKTNGFWISFRPISMRWEKVPQGIDREPTLAAADMVGGGYWRDYRFGRLSNRALAAVSGKCRCGLMGRHFTLVEQSAAARDVGAAAIRGSQVIRCTTICSDLGFAWCMAAGFGAPQARRKS